MPTKRSTLRSSNVCEENKLRKKAKWPLSLTKSWGKSKFKKSRINFRPASVKPEEQIPEDRDNDKYYEDLDSSSKKLENVRDSNLAFN